MLNTTILDTSIRFLVTASHCSLWQRATSARPQFREQRLGFGEDRPLGRIIDPSPITPIRDEASVAKHPEVKRQARLGDIERVGQLANAALAVAQQLENRESRFVRERVEQRDGAAGVRCSGGTHPPQYINKN